MDKIINTHLDKIEELENEFNIDLEKLIGDLNIKVVIDNPEAEMLQLKEDIKELYLNKYADRAVELGISFAELIQKKIDADKIIKVDDSENPNLNKDEEKN